LCTDAARVPDGAIADDEENKAESRAKLRKGAAGEEAGQRAKTKQTEKEAKGTERERDRQRRKKGGLLGDVGDTLTSR
jgi:hypothetical protein